MWLKGGDKNQLRGFIGASGFVLGPPLRAGFYFSKGLKMNNGTLARQHRLKWCIENESLFLSTFDGSDDGRMSVARAMKKAGLFSERYGVKDIAVTLDRYWKEVQEMKRNNRLESDGGECSECGKLCLHRSGLCRDCRTIECRSCGVKVISVFKNQTQCGKCVREARRLAGDLFAKSEARV